MSFSTSASDQDLQFGLDWMLFLETEGKWINHSHKTHKSGQRKTGNETHKLDVLLIIYLKRKCTKCSKSKHRRMKGEKSELSDTDEVRKLGAGGRRVGVGTRVEA